MWCCHNLLLLNPDKTKLFVVGVPQLLGQLPDLQCVVPENIHTPPTEDHWKFRGGGGFKGSNFQGVGGFMGNYFSKG